MKGNFKKGQEKNGSLGVGEPPGGRTGMGLSWAYFWEPGEAGGYYDSPVVFETRRLCVARLTKCEKKKDQNPVSDEGNKAGGEAGGPCRRRVSPYTTPPLTN